MQRMKNELIEEQDQHLDEINEIAGRLKIQGKEISKEIDKQAVLVRDLDHEVDQTNNKLNFVQDKLSKLLKTNDMGQVCTILVLFLILVVMIFLVIYTWVYFQAHIISQNSQSLSSTEFLSVLSFIY